jgi:hypothetical protein
MQRPEPETQQNASLDPRIHAPARGRFSIWRGCAGFSRFQSGAQCEEYFHGRSVTYGCLAGGEVTLDGGFQFVKVHAFPSLSIVAG